MKTHKFLLFCLFSLSSNLFASQTDSTKTSFQTKEWCDIGLVGTFSGTSSESFEGLMVGCSYNWTDTKRLYKLRFNYGEEIQFMSVRYPNEHVVDVGFLCGKEYAEKRLHISVYAGLGLLSTTVRGEFVSRDSGWFGKSYYEDQTDILPAIPLECNLSLYTSRRFGIGVACVGGISPKNVYFGALLKVIFGRL